MKTFNRKIYVGDLHGTALFNDFIKIFNDGNTEFSFLGDLFDRNGNSGEIIELVKELYKEGKISGVLGNHDLFFLFGLGMLSEGDNSLKKRLNEIEDKSKLHIFQQTALTYQRQFYWNGGDATMKSFEKVYGKAFKEKWNENISFLWDNFGLFDIDNMGNLSIHGGLPILPDGSLVGMNTDIDYLEGIELLKFLDKKIKSLDLATISMFTATDGICFNDLFTNMERKGKLKHPISAGMAKKEFSQWFIPTWYDNSAYVNFEDVKKSLLSEMDTKGISKIFTGHWWNKDESFKNPSETNRIFRLDRSFKDNMGQYGNFGYAVIDKSTGAVTEIGDAMDKLR